MTATASPPFPAVILSGGRSSRMGEPKALIRLGGARLLDHVAARIRPQVSDIFLNVNDPAIALPGARTFSDSLDSFRGPLAGIHAGLVQVAAASPETTHALMLPVDCPFFPKDIAATLAASLTGPQDIALAASAGRLHPVIGLWPVALAPALAGWLADPPTLKVHAFLDGRAPRVVEFPPVETALGPLDPFFNVNTPDDLARARRLLAEVGP